MANLPPAQKTTEVTRPRSNQTVSVNWDESADVDTSRGPRLQFEVAECVETKTITTTTTTKRSYPPVFVRDLQPLHSRDAKEYPLATRPTPPELSQFSFDLDFAEADPLMPVGHSPKPSSATRSQEEPLPPVVSSFSRRARQRAESREPAGRVKADPDAERSLLETSFPRPSKPSVADNAVRRSARSVSAAASPSSSAAAKKLSRASQTGTTITAAVSDKLQRLGAGSAREARELHRSARTEPAQSSYLATPDGQGPSATDRATRFHAARAEQPSEPNDTDPDRDDFRSMQSTSAPIYDAASPVGSDSQTVFSNNVATPPVMDAYAEPFADLEDSPHPAARALPPRVLGNVGVLDASLPSPRLSPTLSSAPPPSNLPDDDVDELDDSASCTQKLVHKDTWLNETQSTEDSDFAVFSAPQDSFSLQRGSATRGGPSPMTSAYETRSMLERFDAMPNEMKTFMMYQFLRRCTRKTLHMVAGVVNPALKCDFFKQLPLELSLHILSYLDHRDLCRAAQVSKHWRNIVDSNETGWKELFDQDGFVITNGELQRAITQGWGWQDPAGVDGCEVDLSLRNRMTSTEAELRLSLPAAEPAPRVRTSKRKRGFVAYSSSAERSKRRASAQEAHRDDKTARWPQIHKSEGPMSAASAAALAVPDPQIGLPSLRKLHLFKSLYRRHYMIRQSWTSGKVKPQHVAFTAHPRHVITCLQFDDDKIITGSDDTLIHVYDTKTGNLLKKLEGHEGGVWALQYEGNVLVSGSTDRSVRVWDIDKGLCTQVFYGHTSTVRCLQILMPTKTGKFEDGKPVMMPPKPLIITGSRDNQLRVWRLPEPGSRRYIQTGPPANDSDCPYFIRILSGHTSSVRSVAAHGDILVSGSYDSTVRVWRISTGESLHVLTGHTQRVYSVVLDVERNRCISGSMDSLVKIWDLDTGTCLHTLEGHALLVGLLDLRDEKLVSAAADSTLRVWDPETGRCKNTLTAHTGAITCFQHDGRKVISGSEKTVKMWNVQTGECLQDLLTDLRNVWQVKFDERRCVAAVQRENLTYVEIFDFGAVRDGVPREELGKRKLLNAHAVQTLLHEEQ